MSNEVLRTGEWHCRHSQRPSIADKGNLVACYTAGKLGLILSDIELNGNSCTSVQ